MALGPRHVLITSATVCCQLRCDSSPYLGGNNVGCLRLTSGLALGPGVFLVNSPSFVADSLITTMGIPPGIAMLLVSKRGEGCGKGSFS